MVIVVGLVLILLVAVVWQNWENRGFAGEFKVGAAVFDSVWKSWLLLGIEEHRTPHHNGMCCT